MWSWLKKLVTGGPAAVGADTITTVATAAADVVERWAPGDAKKTEMYLDVQKAIAESVDKARTFDPRTNSTRGFAEFINVLVDAAQRMIRPTVTIGLVGGVFGWWPLATQTLDPIVLSWSETVIGFWFGVRTITKDIPSLIKMLVELKRGAK